MCVKDGRWSTLLSEFILTIFHLRCKLNQMLQLKNTTDNRAGYRLRLPHENHYDIPCAQWVMLASKCQKVKAFMLISLFSSMGSALHRTQYPWIWACTIPRWAIKLIGYWTSSLSHQQAMMCQKGTVMVSLCRLSLKCIIDEAVWEDIRRHYNHLSVSTTEVVLLLETSALVH